MRIRFSVHTGARRSEVDSGAQAQRRRNQQKIAVTFEAVRQNSNANRGDHPGHENEGAAGIRQRAFDIV
jgi:hypothetical protein